MNVWREELMAWESFRRHTIVCPTCHSGPPCAVGIELEAKWGHADELARKAELATDDAVENCANEVALPPEWLDDHAGDWRPGMQEP